MKSTTISIKMQMASMCAIVEAMVALTGMMRASCGTMYRRCGKSTCWCALKKGNGHRCIRLMWAEGKEVKTRSVQEEDVSDIKTAIGQYRTFKDMRRRLKIEEDKLDTLLVTFEKETSKNTKSKMGYL